MIAVTIDCALWIVSLYSFTGTLSRTADGEIMAMEHRIHPIYGVQFHPESILTPQGMQMVKNFLEYHKII